ncbi:MAG: nuclear transport factor 2 family protein [Cenarchaeum sp. SB0665_bin_23]|nr:nuclear transport factor 2 family protein [Cenarchaeum sp. SB0667_bin_13]MXY37385.1 nuclear transport factor 2 family protein [Cenarchaeum sp. SB0664_bin_35]MXY60860.1 nuclear transport factor 2 family protein [Cenarchaeum sp. SB0665_bin_23]MXZ93093.1 nuclear transport factor 2 family protein [Cenarchaeum sp. SB0666_bin_15]MYB46894.1 nuclear transport factor 2 family protein [Cenarchaeum sp. SB0662_bin_33]MYC80314.1 nuclear transport factor 2 family protein [Cenarchaeum sp. SB0661_bin_35]M
MSHTETRQVLDVVEAFFEVGRTKDTAKLHSLQLNDPRFSSFSDVPPLDMKNFDTTLMLEELRFVSISDYNYKLIEPKVSIFGDAAIVAFGLQQTGMLVDNKNYTGEHISIDGRGTFVLVNIDGHWKIVHIHLSRS